jgi:hypothetical protein
MLARNERLAEMIDAPGPHTCAPPLKSSPRHLVVMAA